MMKIITFLGDRGALPTTYSYNDKVYQGGVFAEVLNQFCVYDQMLVCVTEKAREKTWPVLAALEDPRIIAVDIPTGRTDDEMWETFRIITEKVEEKDHVIFDITHGLRSLPFLAFLFAAYLKAAKDVVIKAVYYGALELGDRQKDLPAPVIDLSNFVSIIDWITSTDQFVKSGNAQALANLLIQEGDNHAQNLASGINEIAQGLQLLRPMDVMQQSAKLPTLIQSASPTLSQSVPPFTTLLERVQKGYGDFGLADPINYSNNAKTSLIKQLKIIDWYADKGQTVQALSLAREWLPSLLCYHFKIDPLNKENRDDMELLLSGGKTPTDAQGNRKESPRLAEWKDVLEGKRLRRLWGSTFNLANLRNDVLHAGFRKDPKNAQEIVEKTKEIINELWEIAIAWQLINSSCNS